MPNFKMLKYLCASFLFVFFAAVSLGAAVLADEPQADEAFSASLGQVSKNGEIIEAVKLLEKTPAKTYYKAILGENPTKKPIKISFKNLTDFADFDAIGWKKHDRLYIYVNKKHKNNVPKEALSTIIASIAVHLDEEDSLNEETYSCALEGFLWNYFTTKSPALKTKSSTLKTRHNTLEELFLKSPSDVKYVSKLISINPNYATLPKESKGFSDKEFAEKIAKMYKIYCKYSGAPSCNPPADAE